MPKIEFPHQTRVQHTIIRIMSQHGLQLTLTNVVKWLILVFTDIGTNWFSFWWILWSRCWSVRWYNLLFVVTTAYLTSKNVHSITIFRASWLNEMLSFVSYFRVDFVKYPSLKDVEYFNVTMEPGDCLFIPYKWWALCKLFCAFLLSVSYKEVLSRKKSQRRFPFSQIFQKIWG